MEQVQTMKIHYTTSLQHQLSNKMHARNNRTVIIIVQIMRANRTVNVTHTPKLTTVLCITK